MKTFKPSFCFVIFEGGLPDDFGADIPTKIVNAPFGYQLWFENTPFSLKEQQRLAEKFGGDSTLRRLNHIDSTIDIGGGEMFTFKEIELAKPRPRKKRLQRKDFQSLLPVKLAVKNLTVLDMCRELLMACTDLTLAEVITAMDRERKKLIEQDPTYAGAQEILDTIKEARCQSNDSE